MYPIVYYDSRQLSMAGIGFRNAATGNKYQQNNCISIYRIINVIDSVV